MAKRTTHRSSTGTKLYAVRDSKGKFKDIQSYKRAHGQDIKRKSKSETARKRSRARERSNAAQRAAAASGWRSVGRSNPLSPVRQTGRLTRCVTEHELGPPR